MKLVTALLIATTIVANANYFTDLFESITSPAKSNNRPSRSALERSFNPWRNNSALTRDPMTKDFCSNLRQDYHKHSAAPFLVAIIAFFLVVLFVKQRQLVTRDFLQVCRPNAV